ncbi:SphA family protein [Sphingomonas sp. CLY1604]|uniref:SphA family protein n=1 Tax=Sphingomonas sp. CLY1604 TaxID=3457786 RepID=UPI003FD70F6B
MAILIGLAPSARASEGAGDSIGKGSEGFLAGALPPKPGAFVVVYVNDYEADRLIDGDGHPVEQDFRLSARAAVARLFYMSPITIAGGRLGVFAIGSLASLRLRDNAGRHRFDGLGDLTVGPVLGWKLGDLHPAIAADFVLPVGSYDRSRALNGGSNHVAVRPIVAISYLPASGFEMSAKATYTINATNHATGYTSGDLAHADISASYPVRANLRLGLNGYLLRQTTDDRQAGILVGSDGFRGRVDAIGPALQWRIGRTIVDLKALKEFNARNRAEGTSLWLKVVAPL